MYWTALRFATIAHGDQKRKYSGLPYIHHPICVSEIVSSVAHTPEMLAASLLHDVVEDTDVTLNDIREKFGDTVANYVYFLTDVSKPEDGNRAVRKKIDADHNANGPAEVHTIKVADLIDNSKDISTNDPNFWNVYKKEKAYSLSVLTKADPKLVEKAKLLLEC